MLPAVLKHRHFRNLFWGQAVSQFGDAFYFTFFLFMADKLTGDPSFVGWVMAVQAIPALIFSPIAGWVADHWDRKAVMWVTDVMSAAVMLAFAIYASNEPNLTKWSLLLAAALMSALKVFFAPAKAATIPRIVPSKDLLKANSLSASVQYSMPVIGLALSAPILTLLEKTAGQAFFASAMIVNGLTFLVSAFFLFLLPKIQADQKESTHSFGRELAEGVRYIHHQPALRMIAILTFLFSLAISPFMLVHVNANRIWFGGEYWSLASFEIAFAAPMLVMAILMPRLGIRRPGIAQIIGLSACGPLVALMGLTPIFWPYLLWNLLCGFLVPLGMIPVQTHVQQTVPDHTMGRVQSVLMMSDAVVAPVSNVLAGIVLAWVGPGQMFVILGVSLTLAGLVGLTSKPFLAMRTPDG
jgi:MFS transporter, DHA3 family, macrolide efflux protein